MSTSRQNRVHSGRAFRAVHIALFLILGTWTSPALAQTVTLSGTTTTLPYREYSTRELGDPWDMSQRTDIGWFTWSVDQPASNLTSIGIASDATGNTFFKGQTTTSSPSFFLLDTWQPGSGRLGKIGVNHPIDTTIYNVLYVKMKIANQVLSFTTPPVAQVFWSRDTLFYNIPDHPASTHPYGGSMMAVTAPTGPYPNVPVGPFLTPCLAGQPACRLEGGNWVIYRIPLTIPLMKLVRPDVDRWQNANGGLSANWGDLGVTADSLRIQPFNIPGTSVGEFSIDWVRLVQETSGSATTVNWTGGGTYDVVASTRSDCTDYSVIGYSKTSGFQFQSQMLPPGTYRVGLRRPFTMTGHTSPTPNTPDSCSASTFTVQAPPGLNLTSPHPEGSTNDFATTVLGNAWDFDSLLDIDYSRNANIPDATYGIVSKPATDLAGNDLGSVRVFRNISTAVAGVGDPHIYPLWPIPSPPAPPGTRARGQHNRIDADKYRILTAEVGVERTRDSPGGSIARIIWHVDGEFRADNTVAEIESADIILSHLDPTTQNGGKITLETLQIDMADRASLPVETDTPQPGSGWSNTCTSSAVTTCDPLLNPDFAPGINLFRFDFHEFSAATTSYIRRLKLAALERTGSTFQVRWTPSNPSGLTSTVALKAVPVTDVAAKNYRPADTSCAGPEALTIASGISLAAGSYNWSPATTPGLLEGNEYYVCAQVFVSGVAGSVDEVMSRWPVVMETVTVAPSPFAASPSTLRFAATKSGSTVTAVTSPQAVTITGPAQGWTAVANRTWIQVTNGTGTGAGQFTVSIVNPGNVIGSSTSLLGAVTINATTPGFEPLVVNVLLSVDQTGGAATQPPFGLVDTPVQDTAGIVGTIGVTGWVLDDVGIEGVKIYRNCLAFEPPENCLLVDGLNVVFVGDATLVAGARTDIEALYPSYPQSNRAAWGYLLMTNLLPHIPNQQMFGGQGAMTFYVRARDVEGKHAWLGRFLGDTTPTRVTLANDGIAKPFGAIDTPLQGETKSGVFPNFGWALTPDGNTSAGAGDILVPVNGSTLRVYIDGVPGAFITYNQCRGTILGLMPAGQWCDDDVANIFGNLTPQPTFTVRTSNPTKHRNLDLGRGAIGALLINTTTLSNGVHTIMWGVTDTAGRGDGIGSRYFTVLNTGTDAARDPGTRDPGSPTPPNALPRGFVEPGGIRDPGAAPQARLGSAATGLAGGGSSERGRANVGSVSEARQRDGAFPGPGSRVPDPAGAAVRARTGFSLDAPFTELIPDADGVRHVQVDEMGRLELRFAGSSFDSLRSLRTGKDPASMSGAVTGGYLVANGEYRPLPVGSHLDTETGTFTWAPGVGFVGTYRLAFGAPEEASFPRMREPSQSIVIDVTIRPVAPPAPGEAAIRMALDLPQPGATVREAFVVAGWALDPHAAIGAGIGAVHVWAQRTDVAGAAPVFLGAAALQGQRPDVAVAFGPPFDRAGFSLSAPALDPGTYEVTAYAWNTRTARWEDARTASVRMK